MIYLQDRQIAVIGIDHGYGNIKTANTITPTGVSAYTSEPLFHGDTLIFNGAYYRVGEGHKEFITDKATDEDFYIDVYKRQPSSCAQTTQLPRWAALPAQRDN